MTRRDWLDYLLGCAREEYEMGYCQREDYDAQVFALCGEYQREQTWRKKEAERLKAERRLEKRMPGVWA